MFGVLFDLADIFTESAVAAFAALEVGNGFEEMDAAEVGPEALGDEDFGVSDLPEQVIREAHLARSADEQIGIGHMRGVEMAVDVIFRDALRALVLCLQLGK